MFLGTHTPRLDEKGRLILPAKFRDALTSGLVITKGQELCLVVWPTSEFTDYAQRRLVLMEVDFPMEKKLPEAVQAANEALEKQFMEVMPVPPETADEFLARERKLWTDAVRVAGVSLD